MAEEFLEVRRNIAAFLMSLRRSIDRPFRGQGPKVEEARERFMRTTMMVEEARIRFDAYTRFREEPTRGEWAVVLEGLLSFVDTFMSSDLVDPAVYDRPFILGAVASRINSDAFMRTLIDRENRVVVAQALIQFRGYLEELDIGIVETSDSLFIDDLERIVPPQQVAPVLFDIVDGRIVVASRAPKVAEEDRDNIQSALEHVRSSGEQLLSNLANSNCDRRLLDSVSELHSQLVSEGNIVKIGLTNMACGMIGAQFREELPGAIVGMLDAYNASISMYVAQFPEWDQFAQKAAYIDLGEDDIADVDIAAGDVIEALVQNASLADPEVPKTIAFVRQFLKFPGASSKRAAFAMIRTMENLVSSIVRHSLNFFGKTADNLVDTGSKATSAVIIGLLGIALTSASGIGPAAMRAGAPWVKQAAEIVQRQIEKAAG